MNRREFIRRLVVASVLLGTGAAGVIELTTILNRNQSIVTQPSLTQSGTQTQQNSSSISAPPGYVYIAPLSALSGKTYAYFKHPSHGNSILLSVGGQWKAFSATCTHRTCTVTYQSSSIYCPCHGGTFDPNNGSVTGGPPPSPLAEFGVEVLNNNVYVSTSVVN